MLEPPSKITGSSSKGQLSSIDTIVKPPAITRKAGWINPNPPLSAVLVLSFGAPAYQAAESTPPWTAPPPASRVSLHMTDSERPAESPRRDRIRRLVRR